MGKEFNDVLAMDLKFIDKYIILHMIDTTTRYSQACIVKSKRKENIVNQILKHWVVIFGSPKRIFSDNGGEFNNSLLRDVAELLNIQISTTAAESPWSNGIVERHNATLEHMLVKVLDDTPCSMETA